jgi:hypothetical protein
MGFSLSGFVGGFSQGLTREIEEEEARTQRLEEIAREEASRLRIAREGEKRKKDAILDEATGMMKALGFTDENIQTALSQGIGATNLYIDAAKSNYGSKDYFDPNVMFDVADDTDTPETVAGDIQKTNDNLQIADVASITETSLTQEPTDKSRRADYLRAAFGKPTKEYASLDAYHASIIQQIMSSSDPAKIEMLEAKEKKVLAKIREKQEKNETDGKIDDNWMSAENVIKNFGNTFKTNLTSFKIQYDSASDEILGVTDGKSGQIEIARLRAANDLDVLNNSVAIPDVKLSATIANEISKAKIGLSTYARRVASGYSQVKSGEVDENSLTANTRFDISRFKGIANTPEELNAITFGFSDVVQYQDELLIYVGSNVPIEKVTEQFPFYRVGS